MNRRRDSLLYILAAAILALGIAIGACGSGWYLSNEIASVQFMQREIVALHSDLNRAESYMAQACEVVR